MSCSNTSKQKVAQPKGLKTTLFGYQLEAVDWMYSREVENHEPRGGIFADDMGLGMYISELVYFYICTNQLSN